MTESNRFRQYLWEELMKNAEGFMGTEVLEALDKISDDLKTSGLDSAWQRLNPTNWEEAGDMFDACWIMALSIRLKK